MLTLIKSAFGGRIAAEKPGQSMPANNAFSSIKRKASLSLFIFSLALATTGCVKNDDVQCGDELNPCENIVADEMGDG